MTPKSYRWPNVYCVHCMRWITVGFKHWCGEGQPMSTLVTTGTNSVRVQPPQGDREKLKAECERYRDDLEALA